MRRAGLVVFVGLVLLAVLAARADNQATLQAIEKHLKRADPQPVRKLLTPDVCEELAKEPKAAAEACRHAVIYARSATEDTSDPEDLMPVLEAFLGIAARAVELHPEALYAHVALARARRALCRHRLAEDGVVGPDEWQSVAEAWLGAARCAKGEHRTLDAFLTLLEGAGAGEESRVELLRRAETLGREMLAAEPNHPQVGVGLAEVRFAHARHHFASGERKEALAAAEEVADLVKDLTDAKSPVSSRARSLVNRRARFLRRSKLDRKAEFLTRPRKTRWHYLAFELPWGSHWEIEHSTGKNVQRMTTLSRRGEFGASGRTFIILKRYKWGSEYESSVGDAGGDNPRGLLEQDRKEDLEWLKEITRQKKLIRGKLNRAIPKASGYELRGFDKDGDEWFVRTWYFKSEERSRTFCVRVSRYGGDLDLDPEIRHVLDSIRELPEEE